jgi:hypothetical protein
MRSLWNTRFTNGNLSCTLILLLAFVAGCDSSKTIHDGPVQLPGGAWTSIPTSEFRASHPDIELCIELDGTYDDPGTLQSGVLARSDGGLVTAESRIVNDAGRVIALPRPGTLWQGKRASLCFRQRIDSAGPPFHRAEIRPTAPLTIRRITWFTGERRPFP